MTVLQAPCLRPCLRVGPPWLSSSHEKDSKAPLGPCQAEERDKLSAETALPCKSWPPIVHEA